MAHVWLLFAFQKKFGKVNVHRFVRFETENTKFKRLAQADSVCEHTIGRGYELLMLSFSGAGLWHVGYLHVCYTSDSKIILNTLRYLPFCYIFFRR